MTSFNTVAVVKPVVRRSMLIIIISVAAEILPSPDMIRTGRAYIAISFIFCLPEIMALSEIQSQTDAASCRA